MSPFFSYRTVPWAMTAALLLASSTRASPPPRPAPAVGAEVLREVREQGEARVVISLRSLPPDPEGGLRPEAPGRRGAELLESLPAGSWREGRSLRSVPVIVARLTGAALSRLLNDPRVSRIDRDEKVTGMQSDSVSQIGADRVQALGFTGQGVTVAVLDSGTDPIPNVDLDSSLDGEECFCSNDGGCCPDGTSRQSGPGSAASVTSHGTGVIGIITSDGVVAPLGVAPSARILAIRVLDDGLVGTFGDILEALDWVLENRKDIRLVNMSLAAGPYPPDCDHLNAFNEAVAEMSEILRERGGLMIAAAGNNYSLSMMGSPGCVSSVVSVGAVDAADRVMAFSDATPSLDLLAPGDRILTTGSYGFLISLTGTSAATPHVTGAAALLLSASPGLSAQELEDRLEQKGVPVLDWRNGATYPRVDAYSALVLPLEARAFPAVFTQRSRGRGLSVRVEPLPPFRAADLDPASFTLRAGDGERVPAETTGAELGDGDGDGVPDLTLHFDRREVMDGIQDPGTLVLTVEGRFVSGPDCLGKAPVRILPSHPPRSTTEPLP